METEVAEEVLCKECGGKHAGPCGFKKIIAALSLSLSEGFEGATRWSISDTTAGLLKLHERHALEGAEDTITGVEVRDRAELEEILEWLRWSIAAYESDIPTLLTSMQLQLQDVAQLVKTSAINQPAYLIAVYHARQCVVMSIRGTYNTTDILTDLNPHTEPFLQGADHTGMLGAAKRFLGKIDPYTEPFLHGAAHTGMLGAAKWLLEEEGATLKKLLGDNPGYKLVLTGHSLGGAVAALLAMLIRASALTRFVPTTLGIRPSKIKCWGYGCAPCVNLTIAENTRYIHNVVLQDDVVPRVNPAAIEDLRDEIQETSFSQVLKDGKRKKMIESIERAHVGHVFKSATEAGGSVYQKIRNARAEHAHVSPGNSNSNSNKSTGDASVAEEESVVEDGSISRSNMGDPETDAGIAAKAIVAVAEGPAASKQELERRRLYAPGKLYHIRRQEISIEEQALGPPVPARPFIEGIDAPRNSKYKHHVIGGTDPSSRFGRIILSSAMLSDHGCFNIRDGLLDAIERLGYQSNPRLRIEID